GGVIAAGGSHASGGTGGTVAYGGAPPVDAGCTDPTGFSGQGCFEGAPTDLTTLENTCTPSVCTHFDETRLTKLTANGDRPPLPTAAGGAPGAGAAPGAGGTTGAGGAPSASGGTGATTGHDCEDLKSRGQIVYVTGSSAV